MATAKTWLWIILGCLGVCALGLCVLAGAGVYFVSHHISMQKTTSANALRSLDSVRSTFKDSPLIELDAFERPRDVRRLVDLPTSPVASTRLGMLAWNPDDDGMVRVTLPFWLIRLGHRKMGFLERGHGINFDRLGLDVDELQRVGPALVLDYRTAAGERVLIWTE